jgi:hypothetical protein
MLRANRSIRVTISTSPAPRKSNTVRSSVPSFSVPKETVTGNVTDAVTVTTKTAQAQLRAIVTRIEAMEEEKQVMADDIKDIYTEAKGNGYDVKALRTIRPDFTQQYQRR